MREPPSIEAIHNEIFEDLALPPPGGGGGIMPEDAFGAGSLEDELPVSSTTSRLVGIVFCHPGSKFADEFFKGLQYYHYRSSSFVNFYFAGYAKEWPVGGHADRKVVAKFEDDVEWSFSPMAFISFRKELEARTTWTYAEGTDILLFAARGNRKSLDLKLDFRAALLFNLEGMENDGAFASVSTFLGGIVTFGEKYIGDDPLRELSDHLGLKRAKSFAIEVLLAVLPEPVRKLFKSSKHFAVRDISKK